MRGFRVAVVFILIGMLIGLFYYRIHLQKQSFSLDSLYKSEQIVPIAIIGSGPAGLSAALYGARLGFYTVLFEGPKPGGQLTETGYIENWPGVGRKRGPEVMKDMRNYVATLGAVIIPAAITRVDFKKWPYQLVTDDNEVINALSVVVATGSAPSVLAIPGEREYWGKGVTTCAVCDAPYYKNKEVIVVGGGDSAVEEAIQLASYAKKVTIIVRKDNMRASSAMQKQLSEYPNICIAYQKEIKKIYGDDRWVEGVVVYDNLQDSTYDMPVSGVFLAIGHEPRTKIFEGQLKLNNKGHVCLKNCLQQTSKPGIFAAGDVEDALYRQAGVAAGAGIKAGIEASQFLQKIGWTPMIARSLQPRLYEQAKGGPSCVNELTSIKEFEKKVLRATKPTIVDFYAPHCPSCMHMLPVYELVARKFCAHVNFFKINTANVPAVEDRLNVQRIPCFIVFKEGQQLARYHSIMNKQQMIEFVQQFVD